MTGPSSWRHLTDVQVTERSEAWSELLGLRSNPRTSVGNSAHGGLFSSPTLVPSRTTGARFLPELREGSTVLSPLTQDSLLSSCFPSISDSGRRKSLDSVFSSISANPSKEVNAPPTQGLHSLDPLFAPAECTTSTQEQEPSMRSITTRRSLPRERRFKPLRTLPPSASQPLLHQESIGKRGLSPVSSHSSLAVEAMGRASESMSPISSEAVMQQASYRRAALDFVLELAGPQAPTPAVRPVFTAPDLFKADELPIPAFAIDRDAQVTVWNKQLEQLSGWEQPDFVKGSTTLGMVLQADNKNTLRNKSCLELMRSVLFGMASPVGSRFLLRRRGGGALSSERAGELQESSSSGASGRPPVSRPRSKSVGESSRASVKHSCIPVELRFNRRTDAVGGIIGVLCVVVPLSEAATSQGEPQREFARSEDLHMQRSSVEGSSAGKLASVSVHSPDTIFEHCPPSTSSSCSSESDRGEAGPGSSYSTSSPSSSDQMQQRIFSRGTQAGGPSSVEPLSNEVRALVMDSVDAVRLEMTQNLERCGVEVVSCASVGEALWRFERSLCDPCEGPRFDVIFLELQPNSEELFLAIRDLRRLEVESRIMGQVPPLELVHSSVGPSKSASMESSSLMEEAQDVQAGDVSRAQDREAAANMLEAPASNSTAASSYAEASAITDTDYQEAEKRCLILAVVNLNRWDLAGLDSAMEQCVRSGGDAVIPRSMPLQQLKTALRKLGIRSKYLMFPSRLPRALSGNLHNPLNLSR